MQIFEYSGKSNTLKLRSHNSKKTDELNDCQSKYLTRLINVKISVITLKVRRHRRFLRTIGRSGGKYLAFVQIARNGLNDMKILLWLFLFRYFSRAAGCQITCQIKLILLYLSVSICENSSARFWRINFYRY